MTDLIADFLIAILVVLFEPKPREKAERNVIYRLPSTDRSDLDDDNQP
jgi:hypothetical protein